MFRWRALFFLLLTPLLICSGLAQEPASPPAPQPTPPPATEPKPSQNPSEQSNEKAQPENKITPQQAEELFRDVDTILDFASKDTSLPKKHDVKRRMARSEERRVGKECRARR